MEKIRIDCGCCNGHSPKQEELWKTVVSKIHELWPDIKKTGSHVNCWSYTEWENDEVLFEYSVDCSD